MVNQGRNCLGDITNELPKKDSGQRLKGKKCRRPTKGSGNPLQGQKNRTPLADISHLISTQQPKKVKLSDEEKMDYLLQYYCLPLVNGKVQTIQNFCIEKNIRSNSSTFCRDWNDSGIKELKEMEIPPPLSTARDHYIKFIEKRKRNIAARNLKNGGGKKNTCNSEETLAQKKVHDSEHSNKKKLGKKEREENTNDEIGKTIIYDIACYVFPNERSSLLRAIMTTSFKAKEA